MQIAADRSETQSPVKYDIPFVNEIPLLNQQRKNVLLSNKGYIHKPVLKAGRSSTFHTQVPEKDPKPAKKSNSEPLSN